MNEPVHIPEKRLMASQMGMGRSHRLTMMKSNGLTRGNGPTALLTEKVLQFGMMDGKPEVFTDRMFWYPDRPLITEQYSMMAPSHGTAKKGSNFMTARAS